MSELQRRYEQKTAGYFLFAREDMIRLVEGNALNVLEIGCGGGATGKRMLELGKARWVTGVERVPAQAEIARKFLTEVVEGDFSVVELPERSGFFDWAIAGDVLEHFADPWGVLRKLAKYLRPGGRVVASIPNVRHYTILWELFLKGDWRYRKDGILDETHLRFFTRRSMLRFFADSGYVVESVHPFHGGEIIRFADAVSIRLFREFLCERWLIVARPSGGDPRPSVAD